MQNILDELKIEIRKVSSEDVIDTQKLSELTNTYERMASFNITNVDEVIVSNAQGMRPRAVPGNNYAFRGQNNAHSAVDGLKDLFEMFLKIEARKHNKHGVDALMMYYNFLYDLRHSDNKSIVIDANYLSDKIAEVTMDSIRESIEEYKKLREDISTVCKQNTDDVTEE